MHGGRCDRIRAPIRKGTPETLEQASRLYAGDLLDGIAVRDAGFEAWLLAERQRLRRLQEQALSKLLSPALDTEIRECAARSLLDLDPTRGHSQRELAEHSGIAKQAITNIERATTLPTLRTLERLAVALHVPLPRFAGFAVMER